MTKVLPTLALLSCFCLPLNGAEIDTKSRSQTANSLTELLQLVEQARQAESAEHKQREQRFLNKKSQQQKMLQAQEKAKQSQQALSEELESQFQSNQQRIQLRQLQLEKRLGSLTELFGHLTSTAGDFRSEISNSVVTAQLPGRDIQLTQFIEKMSGSSVLPTVDEIERLWFQLQREMTASGQVVKFTGQVTAVDGSKQTQTITRIGSFNLISSGQYLNYDRETGNLSVLPRQPRAGLLDNRYTSQALALEQAQNGFHAIALDPTGPNGGSFLAALINSPSLVERWKQGGIVGAVISLLALYALAVALWRLTALHNIRKKTYAQLHSQTLSQDSPLGRVLSVFESHKHLDSDSLEYKLAEAILHERPAIERGASTLKIIAMVAPLLGLLGTVVGMIMTFQAITIYGAGDPQTMAGGISSALVTTVLGLCAAVPTVMLHAIVNYRARQVLSILEKQSYGLVAQRVEASKG